METENMTTKEIIETGTKLVDWHDNDEIKILIMDAIVDNYSSNSSIEAMWRDLFDMMSNSMAVNVIEHLKGLIEEAK
jgi:hypothetical protein